MVAKKYANETERKKANSENQRQHREREKKKMGEKDYNKMKAMEAKEKYKRRKNKQLESVKNYINNNNIDSIIDIVSNDSKSKIVKAVSKLKDDPTSLKIKIKNIKRADGLLKEIMTYINLLETESMGSKFPSQKTIKQHLNRIGNLYTQINKQAFESTDLDFLNDSDGVINFINNHKEYNTQNTKTSVLTSIASILKYIEGADEVQKIYSALVTKNSKEIQEELGENKMTDKIKKNYMKWDDVLKFTSTLTKPKDILIASLYTKMPPRRLVDYQLMKVYFLNDKDNAEDVLSGLSDKFNYMLINPDLSINQLVFNVYKTKNCYGQQYIKNFDETINDDLQNYLKVKKLISLNFLFPSKNNNTPYRSFDTVLANLFKKTGKRISCGILRHSFISDLFNKNPNLTINNKKHIAYMMANAISTQECYRYI